MDSTQHPSYEDSSIPSHSKTKVSKTRTKRASRPKGFQTTSTISTRMPIIINNGNQISKFSHTFLAWLELPARRVSSIVACFSQTLKFFKESNTFSLIASNRESHKCTKTFDHRSHPFRRLQFILLKKTHLFHLPQ